MTPNPKQKLVEPSPVSEEPKLETCEHAYIDDLEPDGDDAFDDWIDCHMDRSGQCGSAGSEYCEFECPNRAEQRQRVKRGGRFAP